MMQSPLGGGSRAWERHGTYAYAAAPEGAEVLAPAHSLVEAVWQDAEYGPCVRLAHLDGSRSVFVRLGAVVVGAGQLVDAGATVGRVGRHGAQGFGLEWHAWNNQREPVNPIDWLFATKAGRVVLAGILLTAIGGMFALLPDVPPKK